MKSCPFKEQPQRCFLEESRENEDTTKHLSTTQETETCETLEQRCAKGHGAIEEAETNLSIPGKRDYGRRHQAWRMIKSLGNRLDPLHRENSNHTNTTCSEKKKTNEWLWRGKDYDRRLTREDETDRLRARTDNTPSSSVRGISAAKGSGPSSVGGKTPCWRARKVLVETQRGYNINHLVNTKLEVANGRQP